MRSVLRPVPVLTGHAPDFDPDAAPSNPMSLFIEWFAIAVEAGVLARQSQPPPDPADVVDALSTARAALDADPELVPDDWVSYAVAPERVEFWQGDPERRHQRLQYTLAATSWTKTLLWP